MRLLLLSAFLFFSISISAQKYSEVKIFLDDSHTITDLARMGLEVDHGEYRPGVHIINAFSQREIQKIRDRGFQVEILIDDMTADFLERNQASQGVTQRSLTCEENGGNGL